MLDGINVLDKDTPWTLLLQVKYGACNSFYQSKIWISSFRCWEMYCHDSSICLDAQPVANVNCPCGGLMVAAGHLSTIPHQNGWWPFTRWIKAHYVTFLNHFYIKITVLWDSNFNDLFPKSPINDKPWDDDLERNIWEVIICTNSGLAYWRNDTLLDFDEFKNIWSADSDTLLIVQDKSSLICIIACFLFMDTSISKALMIHICDIVDID